MFFQRYEIDLPELDASFGERGFSDMADSVNWPTQNRHFEAMAMVDVHMERGNGEIMMIVVMTDQTRAQLSFVVIIDVG